MGFSIRSTWLAVGAAALLGPALPAAATGSIPGPPLPSGEPAWGTACPAPRAAEGPWQAAGFGAAALGVGWMARRRGPREPG